MILATPLAAAGFATAAVLTAVYCFRRKSPPRTVGSLLLWPKPTVSLSAARRRDRLRTPPSFWLELFILLALVCAALTPLTWRQSSGSLTVILDTLTAEAPALTQEQQEQLYQKVMEDYADIPLKSERHQRLKSDAYYNAVQIKYGYAVTCHKAQGGQWAHVYIDQGYMTDDMLTPDYLHWLYTALTRATEKVMLVNWPKTQTDDGPA